jgi:hypothetical protein
MGDHLVGGRTIATAATANHVVAQFWNPHSTSRIWVTAIDLCAITGAALSSITLRRSSAKGATPSATETPDLDNAFERDNANAAGMLLELATFTTQPTLDASILWRWSLPASIGAGFMKPFGRPGIAIPPGTGLCIVNAGAVLTPASDVSFSFAV